MGSQVSLTIEEPKQNKPFNLVFDKRAKTEFFDLNEVPQELLTDQQRQATTTLGIREKVKR